MLIIDKNIFSLKGHKRRLQGTSEIRGLKRCKSTPADLHLQTPVKPLGQPSPSVVESPAIIADSLLNTSEVWSQSPIRDIGGVDGESNKAAM